MSNEFEAGFEVTETSNRQETTSPPVSVDPGLSFTTVPDNAALEAVLARFEPESEAASSERPPLTPDTPPPAVDPGWYRAYAAPTWHQRGQECTGFALAAAVSYMTRRKTGDKNAPCASPRMMYEMAQVFDKAAFIEGSTLLGALLGWRRSGVASEAMWPYHRDDEHGQIHGGLTLARINEARTRPAGNFERVEVGAPDTLDMMRLHLRDHKVIYAAAKVHTGWYRLFMDTHGAPIIRRRAGDDVKGGHAFLIVGYDETGFWVHNSWGARWGDNGYGILPFSDWTDLGETAWIPSLGDVTMPESGPSPESTASQVSANEPVRSGSTATDATMWRHVIALDDDGQISSEPPYAATNNTLRTLLFMFDQQAAEWRNANPHEPTRLLIVADDGAMPRSQAVERLVELRNRLLAQRIYPIFLVWDVPWHANLSDELSKAAAVLGPPPEVRRPVAVEPIGDIDFGYLFYEVFVPQTTMAVSMWRAMRSRATEACRWGKTAQVFIDQVVDLWRENPFEIHLAAHGAGDFLLSELAPLVPEITTCQLSAPATSMATFAARYRPMLTNGRIEQMTITALDEDSETSDRIGPYPESVLCLASNVLAVDGVDSESRFHYGPASESREVTEEELVIRLMPAPEPILGMARYLEHDPDIARCTDTTRLEVVLKARRSDIAAPHSYGAHVDLGGDNELQRQLIDRIVRPRRAAGPRPEAPPAPRARVTHDRPHTWDPLTRAERDWKLQTGQSPALDPLVMAKRQWEAGNGHLAHVGHDPLLRAERAFRARRD